MKTDIMNMLKAISARKSSICKILSLISLRRIPIEILTEQMQVLKKSNLLKLLFLYGLSIK